jgi:WD40 repeat protein
MNTKNRCGVAALLCLLVAVLAACQQTQPRDTPVVPEPNVELLWMTKQPISIGNSITSMTWRDEKLVYLGGQGISMLWTPSSNTLHFYTRDYAYSDYSAVWSPDGQRLLSDRYVWQFDAPPARRFSPSPVNSIQLDFNNQVNEVKAWNPSGTEVLVGTGCSQSSDSDPFVIYNPSTGKLVRTLIPKTSSLTWLCGIQASWITDNRIVLGNRLVDANTGEVLMTLGVSNGRISQDRFFISPNGSKIAQVSQDESSGNFFLEWYTTTDFSFLGEMVLKSNNNTIKWLFDETHLAVSDFEQPFIVYNTTTNSIVAEIQLHFDGYFNFEFSPDLKTLITRWDNDLYIWDTTELQNPNSWELTQFLALGSKTRHNSNVYSLVEKNKKTLLSTGRDGQIMEFQARFGVFQRSHLTSNQAIYALQYSTDGNTYATAGEDSTIYLWNGTTREEIGTLTGHTYTIRALAWKPNSPTLASVGWDDSVRIWNTQTQTLEQTQTDHTDYVNAVQYNPSGTQFVSASSDGTIKLRNPDTGQTQHTLKPQDSSSPVFAIGYSSDGAQLASGSQDHRVRIWDTTTQTLTSTLKGHLGAVRAVVWLNPTTLVTGGMDGRIIVWDVPNQKLLLEVKPDLGAVFVLTVGQDGKTFYAGFDSGNLAAWKVTP